MARQDGHCPHCGVFVKPENLPSHLRKAHAKAEEAARLERTSKTKTKRGRRPAKVPVWAVAVVAIVVAVAAFAVLRSGEPSDGGNLPPLTEMCVQHGGIGVHYHVQMHIVALGQPYLIPTDVGIVSPTCMRPLHTHAADGVIHVELPSPRTVRLSDFFAIWGQPFSETEILQWRTGTTHEIVFTVNGAPSGAYQNLVLQDGQEVVIDYRAL